MHGRPAILGHLYQSFPAPITKIIVFSIRRTGGAFGTVIAGTLPQSVNRNGYLRSIFLQLQRRYVFRGSPRAYLSARCAAPAGFPGALFPFARASMSFDDGRTLSSTLVRSCKVKSRDLGTRRYCGMEHQGCCDFFAAFSSSRLALMRARALRYTARADSARALAAVERAPQAGGRPLQFRLRPRQPGFRLLGRSRPSRAPRGDRCVGAEYADPPPVRLYASPKPSVDLTSMKYFCGLKVSVAVFSALC